MGMIGMLASAVASSVWLLCAALVLRRGGETAGMMRVGLAVAGVPLVGAITYLLGPLLGLGALALGTILLCLHRLPRWRGRPLTRQE